MKEKIKQALGYLSNGYLTPKNAEYISSVLGELQKEVIAEEAIQKLEKANNDVSRLHLTIVDLEKKVEVLEKDLTTFTTNEQELLTKINKLESSINATKLVAKLKTSK